MSAFYQWNDPDLILFCRIQTNSAKNEISEIFQQTLKIRITSLPIDGKANRHLISFLAGKFKVPKRHVTILKGRNNRRKKICIHRPGCIPLPLQLTEIDL